MNILHQNPVALQWAATVMNAPAGELLLVQTPAGYIWCWKDKPSHLVSLVGVMDNSRADSYIPYLFFEVDYAIGHLMSCSGYAYRGLFELHEIQVESSTLN